MIRGGKLIERANTLITACVIYDQSRPRRTFLRGNTMKVNELILSCKASFNASFT
jgi:hypothetical protein